MVKIEINVMNAKYKKERKREILLRNLPYNAEKHYNNAKVIYMS